MMAISNDAEERTMDKTKFLANPHLDSEGFLAPSPLDTALPECHVCNPTLPEDTPWCDSCMGYKRINPFYGTPLLDQPQVRKQHDIEQRLQEINWERALEASRERLHHTLKMGRAE